MTVDDLYPKKQSTMYESVRNTIFGKTNSKAENDIEYLER